MHVNESRKVLGKKLVSCASEEKHGKFYVLLEFEDDSGRLSRLSVASDTKMEPKVRLVSLTREKRGAWNRRRKP